MTLSLDPGKNYRLKANLRVGACEFRSGEVVTCTSAGYSPYDDCYVYHFVDSTGGRRMCTAEDALSPAELEKLEAI